MPTDFYQIKDPEIIRAIADPLRLEIINLTRKQKLSARQLAKVLNEPTKNLYYHLNELERHGIIEVAETKQKGNLLEKYYQAKYSYLTFAPELLMFNDQNNQLFFTTIASGLQRTLINFQKAAEKPAFWDSHFNSSLLSERMTMERYNEFLTKLNELVNEYFDDSESEGPMDVTFSCLCFSTPTQIISDNDKEQDDTLKQEGND